MAEKDSISGSGAAEDGGGHEAVGVADQDGPLLPRALEGGDQLLRRVQPVDLLDRAHLLRLLPLLLREVADHGLVLGELQLGGRRGLGRGRGPRLGRGRGRLRRGGLGRYADLEGLAQLAEAPLLVVAEGGVALDRLEERRAPEQTDLVDDHELRELLGQLRSEPLDGLVGEGGVLQRGLAQIPLRAVSDHPGENGSRGGAVLGDGQELGSREGGEGLGGGLPDARVGVAHEVRPHLEEILGLEGEETLGRHEPQIPSDPAAAKLLDERVGDPRVRHERPSRSVRRWMSSRRP
jgi:hypothetical protein